MPHREANRRRADKALPRPEREQHTADGRSAGLKGELRSYSAQRSRIQRWRKGQLAMGQVRDRL